MKTLPDSPSLDHLRQQAKGLLAHLRVARPEATLSDAQTLVAEQYGFRTWPELKAEVDRRCANVRAPKDGAAAAVADAFDLGTPAGPLVARERQWAGQAWTLTTDRGRWLARQLFDWFDEGAVETEVALAEAAASAGIRTLAPVRSRTGAVIETLDGSRWRIYELAPLGPEPTTPADGRHAAAAGRIIARVHGLGLPAHQPVQRWLTFVRPPSRWHELRRAAEAAGAPWAERLAEVIPRIIEVSGIVEAAGADDTPVLSACHYAPNAFRVAGADDLIVTSWEHVGAMPPRWDLGGALASWSVGASGEVNASAAKGLLAGYAEQADIPGCLDIGIFSAHICANLNWLATRIMIALQETDAESRELAARAVPALLVDFPSRERFERILSAV